MSLTGKMCICLVVAYVCGFLGVAGSILLSCISVLMAVTLALLLPLITSEYEK